MAHALTTVVGQVPGAKLLPDDPKFPRFTHRLQVRSSSSDNLYVVSWNKVSQEWGCSCMGWIRNHGRFPGYQCQHLKPMVPALEAARKRMGIAGNR